MTPLVSILIPCYNAEPWIAETLESALAQTWPHKEIIFVDDGSTDRSRSIAQSFVSRGITLCSQERRGASAARNLAFRKSSGGFIQYLDADDLLDRNKITIQMQAASRIADQTMLISGVWDRFTVVPGDMVPWPRESDGDAAPLDWLIRVACSHSMMHPAAWLSPRALLERAGAWNESLSRNDDGEYFTRVVLSSAGIHHCRDAQSYYRSNVPGSLSALSTEAAVQSHFRSCGLFAEKLLAAEDSPRTRLACAANFQALAYELYPGHRKLVAACEQRARDLGGSQLQPLLSPAGKKFAKYFGWKAARCVALLRRRCGLS